MTPSRVTRRSPTLSDSVTEHKEMPGPEISLSAREARRVALSAQALLGPRLEGGPAAVLRRVRAVQLDTISVLARSHELTTFARVGPIGRARIDEGYWGPASTTFEYWSHAACILPLEDWPAYGFKRRALRRAGTSLAPPRERGQELLICPRPSLGRGTSLGPGARRSQEGRPMVGLERDQDRRRVALGHRRARLPQAQGFPARLRPGGACHPC